MVKPLFSERRDPEKLSSFYEGVPDFLFPSLLNWTLKHFLRNLSGKRTTDQQMILRLERRARRALPPAAKTDLQALAHEFRDDDNLLLDAIDFALSQKNYYGFGNQNPEELEGIPKEAGSAYCVGTDEDDNFELQFRQPEEMTDLLEAEVSLPGNAAAHLRKAW